MITAPVTSPTPPIVNTVAQQSDTMNTETTTPAGASISLLPKIALTSSSSASSSLLPSSPSSPPSLSPLLLQPRVQVDAPSVDPSMARVKSVPLTPIKRNFNIEEDEKTSVQQQQQSNNIVDVSNHAFAMPSFEAATSSAVPASSSSASSSSSFTWPWYLVSSVSGRANAAYADFVPIEDAGDADDWYEAWHGSNQTNPLGSIDPQQLIAAAGGGVAHDFSEIQEREQAKKRQRLDDERMCISPVAPGASASAANDAPQSSLHGSNGQDSYFSVSRSSVGCCVLGVADGVGGWRENGVDSGEISRAIMKTAREIALEQCTRATAAAQSSTPSAKPFALNPSEILTRAYNQVKAAGIVKAGSTTACIVALTPLPVNAPAPASTSTTPTLPADPTSSSSSSSSSSSVATSFTSTTVAAAAVSSTAATILAPSIPPTSALAPNLNISLAEYLSSPATLLSDLVDAMVDVNQNVIANEVGTTHVESTTRQADTTLITQIDSEWIPSSAASSPPISIPPRDPSASIAIDESPQPPPNPPAAPDDASFVPESESAGAAKAVQYSPDRVYLSAANLGDSGYTILRRSPKTGTYQVVQMSDLQRTGRTVRQLAIIPKRFANDSYCDDSPSDAELDSHEIMENDIIILATDGLWDNLIATDWSQMLFAGWRLAADIERTAKQRKTRMCATIETIAAECSVLLAQQHAKVEAASKQPPSAASSAVAHSPSTTARPTHDLFATPSPPPASSRFEPKYFEESKEESKENLNDYHQPSSTIQIMQTSNAAATTTVAVHHVTTSTMEIDSLGETQSAGASHGRVANTTTTTDMIDTVVSDGGSLNVVAEVPLTKDSSGAYDWDNYEVRLFAHQLQHFATSFMLKVDGKPDDITCLVTKVKSVRQ